MGASDGVLYAFPEAGCGSATCSPDWTATIGGSITQSVAVNGTTVFVGSSNGMLEAFPVGGCGSATCSPEWSATVGGSVSAPAVGGPLVYVASTNDLLDAFAAAGCGNPTCTAEWQVNCHRPVDTAPAASNGVVFVTDAVHTLHAYGPRSAARIHLDRAGSAGCDPVGAESGCTGHRRRTSWL